MGGDNSNYIGQKDNEATMRYKAEIALANLRCFRFKKKGHKIRDCSQPEGCKPIKCEVTKDKTKVQEDPTSKKVTVTATTFGAKEYRRSDDEDEGDNIFGSNFNFNLSLILSQNKQISF